MNRLFIILVLLFAAAAGGFFIGQVQRPAMQAADADPDSGEPEILYWVAPMDPNYRRDGPGKSPMGMDLVPVYAGSAGAVPGTVSIDPVVVSNLGVRTARAAFGSLPRQLRTVGYVGYDENTMQQVSTRVAGWVEKLAVRASGDPVSSGQLLFELYSPDLVNAQEEYLAALRSNNTVLRRASRERLAALGVSAAGITRLEKDRQVKQRTRVYAKQDGIVAHLGIREGGYVTPATPIMTIAALDRVWVVAEVFERQAGWVQQGQQARVSTDYLPGQTRVGSVDYVYPELDPKTRTLKVRLGFANPDGVLRPNMFVRVEIDGQATESVVHVPREALIRGGTVNRVVLALGDGQFRSQPVEPGLESGDRVAILDGLAAGDVVVTSGQFLIDSESNIDVALGRMEKQASRVTVGAVVEGWRVAQQRITLMHDPVEEWSWPAMSMAFDVADPALLDDLSLGQRVDVVIEEEAGDRFVITAIKTGSMP
ncbi:MAG: efflux RND transporter periplasmic adaptor subunit [Gammaproteobacteria bacterium]|nr:efflux RND transporter periplasmic adaptor subunit [Gammaproteobacteria bacterium]NNF59967.1 efflux RND transporter periplasmic adaptor subunit [Gammaproteobacteria bacterium]NNM19669.1 efflux RND transporter periplasmic adaptor subunit [Gammaproteobacteria bacterium]